MSPAAAFAVAFGVTLVLLLAVVATGLRAQRRAHVTLVVLTFASLGWTIHEAYQLGAIYDLAAAGPITPIHLTLARIATAALFLPVISGIRTLRNPAGRVLHRKLAFLALTLVVLAAITGVLMIQMAPLAQPVR